MKLWRLLILPWYGTSSTRWSVGALIFLTVLMSALFGFASAYTPPLSVHWMQAAVYGLAFLNVVMWAALLPNILLMAVAARRLQVPGAQRDAYRSLSFYAVLSIVLPVALIGAIGGNVAVVAVELVLGAGVGMAFALLPSYCTSVLFLVAAVHGVVWRWLALPNDMQSGFLPLTVSLAVALWLAIVWLWQRALRPQATLDGLHAPMFFLARLGKWQRLLGGSNPAVDTQLAGQIPAWLRDTVALGGSGPGHAVQSLRVALGAPFTPQTRSSRARKTVIGVFACSLIVGVFALQAVGDAQQHGPSLAMGVRVLLMCCIPFVSVAFALTTANVLRRRWSRSNAEMPLLALLPGLGDPAQIKRALLRASLPPALRNQTLLLAASLFVAVWWHLDVESDLLLVLSQLCGVALLLVLTLMVFAGASLSGRNLAGLIVLGLFWYFLPFISVLVSYVPVPSLGLAIGIGWLAAAGVLFWLGRRGWQGLQQRPHPFLVS